MWRLRPGDLGRSCPLTVTILSILFLPLAVESVERVRTPYLVYHHEAEGVTDPLLFHQPTQCTVEVL